MLLTIQHRTTYAYERPVTYGLQQLRLIPKTRDEQEVLSWDTRLEGATREAEFQDHHMNHVMLISIDEPVDKITITSSGQVDTKDAYGIIGKHGGFAPLWYFEGSTDLTRAGNLTRKLTKGLTGDISDPIDRLHALSGRILDEVKYEVGETHVATSAEDALSVGRGVCQDHAHIFLAAARTMGFPSRYVSGYLKTEDGAVHDAAHAWAEAHVKGVGWIGFDISNGISPDERYVRVATGRDYMDAAPISGLSFGDHGKETLSVDIQVQQ
ncbi:transglutaminase family protein [Litoreibacter roseus]|uniref:Transglutaminase n=1 Tax=Litoreibacter roseus TaxID=2601869 RepID=A0A6N6JJN4_9RHOB|nr:transglutaminase family protein [Litoreibacter roseus]GFE66344.1 transglutaminase [Litoreibacter roseus]